MSITGCIRSDCDPKHEHRWLQYRPSDGRKESYDYCVVPGCKCLGFRTQAQEDHSYYQVIGYEEGGWPKGDPFRR